MIKTESRGCMDSEITPTDRDAKAREYADSIVNSGHDMHRVMYLAHLSGQKAGHKAATEAGEAELKQVIAIGVEGQREINRQLTVVNKALESKFAEAVALINGHITFCRYAEYMMGRDYVQEHANKSSFFLSQNVKEQNEYLNTKLKENV